MVSMARPFLADAEFVAKARQGRAEDINTCIGCNQACLDHIFSLKITSCLVNPRACHETEIVITPTETPRSIAVVGAGPAGLAFATTAAERGHRVTLFEADNQIGGQFNIAKTIPGKEEFHETLRYFGRRLDQTGVDVRLNTRVSADDLAAGGFDEIVLATGITPRRLDIPGADDARTLSYLDVLRDHRPVGEKVAIIGAGGIGFDVAEYITHGPESASLNPEVFFAEWGVDTGYTHGGGLTEPHPPEAARDVWLLQRKASKVGAGLGKTTGWIHRAGLVARDVAMMPGVTYERIESQTLAVDTVIVCAGQEPNRDLFTALEARDVTARLIGGADVAAELDAKHAIHQGVTLAAEI
jgi:2,4-dienoyl-CoA reductase (NADPH2)